MQRRSPARLNFRLAACPADLRELLKVKAVEYVVVEPVAELLELPLLQADVRRVHQRHRRHRKQDVLAECRLRRGVYERHDALVHSMQYLVGEEIGERGGRRIAGLVRIDGGADARPQRLVFRLVLLFRRHLCTAAHSESEHSDKHRGEIRSCLRLQMQGVVCEHA